VADVPAGPAMMPFGGILRSDRLAPTSERTARTSWWWAQYRSLCLWPPPQTRRRDWGRQKFWNSKAPDRQASRNAQSGHSPGNGCAHGHRGIAARPCLGGRSRPWARVVRWRGAKLRI